MAELTVYADDTSDGQINSTHPSYATARAGTENPGSVITSLAILIVGQNFDTDIEQYTVIEAFLNADVSELGGDATGAIPYLWLVQDFSSTDFTIQLRAYDWGDTLEAGDFVAGDDLSALPLLATLDTSGIGATGEYKAFNAEDALVTAINTARAGDGVLPMLLCSSRTAAGNEPSGLEIVQFSSADDTSDPTQKPMLVITYEEAADGIAAPGKRMGIGLGLGIG